MRRTGLAGSPSHRKTGNCSCTLSLGSMRSATSKVYTVRIAFVTVFSLFPLVCLTADTVPGETGVAPSAADADFFERRIRPILVEHCIACHGPKKQESGLRLDTRQSIIKGGDTGSAANPGKPKKSLLQTPN